MSRVYGPGWGQEKRVRGRRLAIRCCGPRGFADCGPSLLPQDAASGSPENPRRFRVLPTWGVVRPHTQTRATEGFFHGLSAQPAGHIGAIGRHGRQQGGEDG